VVVRARPHAQVNLPGHFLPLTNQSPSGNSPQALSGAHSPARFNPLLRGADRAAKYYFRIPAAANHRERQQNSPRTSLLMTH